MDSFEDAFYIGFTLAFCSHITQQNLAAEDVDLFEGVFCIYCMLGDGLVGFI